MSLCSSRVPFRRRLRLIVAATMLCTSLAAPRSFAAELDFNRDVLPILAENCYACHGFDEAAREADLRLDDRDAAIESEAVVPGKPDDSSVIARIFSGDKDEQMPPPDSGKNLTSNQKQVLRTWIDQGAKYTKHWSFERPKNLVPPKVAGVQHPIDRFIQNRLTENKIQPSPLASPETLIRRASLDLIGLPPSLAEIDAFKTQYRLEPADAWKSLIDRLLHSPHYGERWGRWWLDQARYGDSNGYSVDSPRSIWKYRDWVLTALNDDMPFDQFTIEQLAGDLLKDATTQQQVATGFHRNTQINQEGGIDREQYRIDSIFDRVATTGTVWLGLTIGCAQCHDHKFDPIKQEEFYQLFAFLNNQEEPTIKIYDPGVDPAKLKQTSKKLETQINDLITKQNDAVFAWEDDLDDAAKKKLPSSTRKALGVDRKKRKFAQRLDLYVQAPLEKPTEFSTLKDEYTDTQSKLNGAPTTMVLRERSSPRKTTVFIKGDFTRPAQEVTPGTPAVLHEFKIGTQAKANRLDLANWIVDPDNPLTARVIVNRIWQQYFGVGLVATENDFGLVGARPTHPELLDWMANEFVRGKWSLKDIHRLILTSHTYQQSSHVRKDLLEVDADNRLLARQSRLRLDAEIVRDVGLAASGLLSRKMGGAPVYPPIPTAVMSQGQVRRSWPVSKGEDRHRRGLYTFIYRATPPPSLSVFDAPDGFSSCTRRNRSNTPLQSLALMNDMAFFEFAQALSKIVETEGIDIAMRRCTGRLPTAEESEILSKLDPLTCARALLALDETITRE